MSDPINDEIINRISGDDVIRQTAQLMKEQVKRAGNTGVTGDELRGMMDHPHQNTTDVDLSLHLLSQDSDIEQRFRYYPTATQNE